MIQINELRIGNLIERNGIIATIEVINNELDEVYFLGKDFYYSDFCCNITPIPLTKDWLSKFGFFIVDYNSEFEASLPNIRYSVCKIKGYNGFLFCDSKQTLTHFNYVHQLQNLYFALTGAELTVA